MDSNNSEEETFDFKPKKISKRAKFEEESLESQETQINLINNIICRRCNVGNQKYDLCDKCEYEEGINENSYLRFGQYKDKTIAEVRVLNKEYLKWVIMKCITPRGIKIKTYLLKDFFESF